MKRKLIALTMAGMLALGTAPAGGGPPAATNAHTTQATPRRKPAQDNGGAKQK